MAWPNHYQRKMHPKLVLGIFVIDTVELIHRYHTFLSSRSPNVYRPRRPYVWQFLAAAANHKLPTKNYDSSDAVNVDFHLLKAKNPPAIGYQLLACNLSNENNSRPCLSLIGKDGDRTVDTTLKQFFESFWFLLILSELLGYVCLVDTQFYELHELKVKKRIGNQPEEDEILPAVQGWFGVDVAKQQVGVLRSFAPDAPFVIAALNLDRSNAMPIDELRAALGINKDVPILPCETSHTASVHQVLFELLERHELFYGKNAHADLARELI